MKIEPVEYFTPQNTMTPIGPYSHIARAGDFIIIGAVAGIDPVTGALAGADITSQTIRILVSFQLMLKSVGSDLDHILHINVFLKDMQYFAAMNDAYKKWMGQRKPARTVIRSGEYGPGETTSRPLGAGASAQPVPHNPLVQRENPAAAGSGERFLNGKWRRERD